jgi:hypothetical protein
MSSERGQSLIETLLLGLFFMMPLLWGLGVVADLHRTALAATSAARAAGFEAASADDLDEARFAADRAIHRALLDHGVDPTNVRVDWSLSRLERGQPVEILVSYPVTVLSAPFIGKVTGPSVWIHAKTVARIDPYRSRR